MHDANYGGAFKAPPIGRHGGTLKAVFSLEEQDSNKSTNTANYFNGLCIESYNYCYNSISHGSKTEQFIAALLLNPQGINSQYAKDLYGDNRLSQRVNDISIAITIDRDYRRVEGNKGRLKAYYYLNKNSIPKAVNVINKLRNRRGAAAIEWRLSHD